LQGTLFPVPSGLEAGYLDPISRSLGTGGRGWRTSEVPSKEPYLQIPRDWRQGTSENFDPLLGHPIL